MTRLIRWLKKYRRSTRPGTLPSSWNAAASAEPQGEQPHPAYRKSRYPYILISDSNVMVGADYLREIMRHTGTRPSGS